MPIQKFRSIDEVRDILRVLPGTETHTLALRSVFWMAARFAPPHSCPPGVHKYRTLEAAQADRRSWKQK